MQIPVEWEFIKWSSDDAIVYIPSEGFHLFLVQTNQNPFYAAILAAHGPVHEPTDAQIAREAEITRQTSKLENKQKLRGTLRRISSSVDNPSHWNRLSPEIKSQMQTHYRELLRLRDHVDFDGSGRIDEHIPPIPTHDVLEDQDSTPHRENPF